MLMNGLWRIIQAIELIRDNGWSRFRKDLISFDRKAIVAEKNLDEAEFATELFEQFEIRFLDLTLELLNDGHFCFKTKNRYFKAKEYLGKGYGGHAIARGRKIIGDIWYYPMVPMSNVTGHTDLRWLGIKLEYGCVYSFDIYLPGDFRGQNLSAALQRSSMYMLWKKGFTRAHAYYWSDNIPAVWNTRVVNKWIEQKTLRVSSIFLSRKVTDEQPIPSRSSNIHFKKE